MAEQRGDRGRAGVGSHEDDGAHDTVLRRGPFDRRGELGAESGQRAGQVLGVDLRRVDDPDPVGVRGETPAEPGVGRPGLAPAGHHEDGAADA